MVFLARYGRALLLLAVAGIAGCAVVRHFWPGEQGFGFSHRAHVQDQGLECADCHEAWRESDSPGMPSLESCMMCHEDVDAEKPEERRISTLFDGEVFRAARVNALPEDVQFSHQAHAVDYGLDCALCHVGIESNARITQSDRVTMADCTRCHVERAVSGGSDCATCHLEIGKDWQPQSHARGWTELHGQAFRSGSQATADRCSLCHTETACAQCHDETAPRDHNNFWRLRGHWVTASTDRDRCAVCHRTDFCDRCHRETRPRSHAGAWGSPLQRHCLSCHFPLRSEGCVACHKGTPGHDAAPPPPDNDAHMTATDSQCRECHVPLKIPHPDNGDSCRLCHQ